MQNLETPDTRKCRNWQTSKTKDLVVVTSCGFKSHLPHDAEVAELADAHGSGPCDSNIMRVQVPSSARRLKSKDLSLFCLVESSDGTSHHQFARSVQYASRSSLPSIPFTAIPSPIKLQTWIVASGKPFESCKHSHRQPSAASASSPPTHSAGKTPGMDRPIP